MGLILDSNVVIAGERRSHTVSQILQQWETAYGQTELGLSVVTVVELIHGVYRTKDGERRTQRQTFVDELIRDVPVYLVTVDIARLAGKIEGEQAEQGMAIPFEDLLIAATALNFGFAVATANVRHFQVIPGLMIIPT